MPEAFDPAWEYWEPDPEIAELLAEESDCDADWRLFPDPLERRLDRGAVLGLRFGSMRSMRAIDHPWLRLARPRYAEPCESGCQRVECQWCGREFLERRPQMGRCCSWRCGVLYRARQRRLRPDSATCRVCGNVFAPKRCEQVLCSRPCASQLGASKVRIPRVGCGCPVCGQLVTPGTRGMPKVYCSRRCKKVAINRRYAERQLSRRTA